MTTFQPPFPGTTRFRVTLIGWDNGDEGGGEAVYGEGRWFVPESEHDACCNWLRAEIRRLHQENETLRNALSRDGKHESEGR